MKMLARGRWSPDDSDNCADIFFNRGMRFNIQKYDTQRLIGRGAFGSVYEYMSDDLKVAIKALNNIRDFKLFKHEIKILLHLQGLPNIIRCFGVLHKTDTRGPAIVLEHFDPCGFQDLAERNKPKEIKFYMRELLIAIDACHSHGIIHRDIKPENILIDLQHRRLRLIDFGLATYYCPVKDYSLSVCTLNFRPPEVLLGYTKYNFALDLWSFGCIFAILIFKRSLFNANNEDELLMQIVRLLGGTNLVRFAQKYHITLTRQVCNAMKTAEHILLEDYITKRNRKLVTLQALILIRNLLKYDHYERLTAKEALEHKYFSQ